MKPNLLILPLIFSALACSPKPPPLAQPPADYSSDPDVQALVERMLSDAQANLGSATARRSLGLAYAANDLWIPARDCFRAALELDPKDLESRYQLAVAFGEAGDLPAKVQTLEALIADQPDYSPAVYLLAVEYLDQGQLDRAQPLFERVARNLPEMPHGLMGLGELALARDESVQAARQLEKAYQLAPMDTYIGFLLGQAYLGQGRESEAQPLLALGSTQGRPRLNPKSTVEMRSYRVSRSARLSEAVASLKKKDYAAAVSVLEDLHRKDPKDTTCLNNLAIAYLGTNQPERALPLVDEALALSPDQFESHLNRAACELSLAPLLQAKGQASAAQAALQTALESVEAGLRLAPQSAKGYSLRGRVLEALGRPGDAVAAFLRAIDLGATEEEMYIHLIRVMVPTQGLAEAIRMLGEGIAQPGPRLDLRYQECGMLLQDGQGALARERQRAMAALAPQDPRTLKMDNILRKAGF